jgi:hypothetical protein
MLLSWFASCAPSVCTDCMLMYHYTFILLPLCVHAMLQIYLPETAAVVHSPEQQRLTSALVPSIHVTVFDKGTRACLTAQSLLSNCAILLCLHASHILSAQMCLYVVNVGHLVARNCSNESSACGRSSYTLLCML